MSVKIALSCLLLALFSSPAFAKLSEGPADNSPELIGIIVSDLQGQPQCQINPHKNLHTIPTDIQRLAEKPLQSTLPECSQDIVAQVVQNNNAIFQTRIAAAGNFGTQIKLATVCGAGVITGVSLAADSGLGTLGGMALGLGLTEKDRFGRAVFIICGTATYGITYMMGK